MRLSELLVKTGQLFVQAVRLYDEAKNLQGQVTRQQEQIQELIDHIWFLSERVARLEGGAGLEGGAHKRKPPKLPSPDGGAHKRKPPKLPSPDILPEE